MVREHGQPDSSACPTPGLLLRHVLEPEGLTEEQCEEISLHVAQCNRCARTYSAMCSAHLGLMEEARQAAGIPEPEPVPALEVEESLARIWQRIHAIDAAERRQRRRTLVFPIARVAAAACILIAIGVGWVMMHKGKSSQFQPGIATHGGAPAAFAELVTSRGREPLAMNQPIATSEKPQGIILGGMHRVVMNCHTKATFTLEPKRTEGPYAGKVPYNIHLAQGELYVEVVPGNPFTVKTANARLDITGTEFNVVADGEKTELTLLRGSIQFSAHDHPQEAVSVTTGHVSIVVGRRAPTDPTPTDALATTAWARGTELPNILAGSQNQCTDDILATLSEGLYRQPSPPDVDTLDYEKWREEHRQGQLALTALAALPKDKAVNADWIEVLMISGDIWQFHSDPNLPGSQPLTRLQPQAITRLARHYGLDAKDILKALGLLESALASMPIQDGAPGRQYAQALRSWHDAIVAAIPVPNEPGAHGDLQFFSLRAGYYLADTRTAAYLWAKTHPDKARQLLADREYLAMLPTPQMASNQKGGAPDVNAWLKQLHDEANAARSLVPAAMDWLLIQPETGCAYQGASERDTLASLVVELTPPVIRPESRGSSYPR